jgi:uncharacterized protein involved in exopolysaccharide biosynthesis
MKSSENNAQDQVELAPVPGFFVPARLVETYSLPARQVRILGALRRQWYWMVGSVLTCLLAATLAAWTITPQYRAEVLLAPVVDESAAGLSALTDQVRGLASLAGVGLGVTSSRKDEAIATLRSRAFTASFIEEQQLQSVLLARNNSGVFVRLMGRPETPTLAGAVRLFEREIRWVNEDKRTGLVRLAVQWKDPDLAAAWANALVENVNARMRNEAIEGASRSLAYLDRELAKSSTIEVRNSIFRLIEGQKKLMMVASVRPEYAFKVIDPATPPDRPVSPRRALLIAIGILIGCILGVALCLWRDSASVRGREIADV